jgi:hypothetical protein
VKPADISGRENRERERERERERKKSNIYERMSFQANSKNKNIRDLYRGIH